MALQNVLEYGIAINFFGNYQQESQKIESFTTGFTNNLLSLRNMLIGGSLTIGLLRFSNSIMETGKTMEQNFAQLKSALGSNAKALEALSFAQKKGVESPFEISEVNQALSLMTSMGLTKTKDMREEVFNAIGDFAGVKGIGFSEAANSIIKAGFGNWESLGDRFGIRSQTIGGMVTQSVAYAKASGAYKESLDKALGTLKNGVKGSEEYRLAVIRLMGALGEGGMKNRLDTVSGALSNVSDIMENFMIGMIGYSQVQNTLFNLIARSIKDKVLAPFDAVSSKYDDINDKISTNMTVTDRMGQLSKRVGDFLGDIWLLIDTKIGQATESLIGWILRMDRFFADYQNNIAPIVLFLALVQIEVESFFTAFKQGWMMGFLPFIEIAKVAIVLMANLLGLMNSEASSTVEKIGSSFGFLLGVLMGFKVLKFVTAPFRSFINLGDDLISTIKATTIGYRNLQFSILGATKAQGAFGVSTSGVSAALSSKGSGIIALLRVASIGVTTFATTLASLAVPILAVVALGAAVYLVWQNWGLVSEALLSLYEPILKVIAFFFPILRIPILLIRYWKEFKQIFMDIWNGLSSFIQGIWIYIKVGFQQLGDYLGSWVTYMVEKFGEFTGYIKEEFPIIYKIFEGLGWVIGKLGEGFSFVFNKVIGFFTYIRDIASGIIGAIFDKIQKLTGAFSASGDSFLKDAKKFEVDYKVTRNTEQAGLTPVTTGKSNNFDSRSLFEEKERARNSSTNGVADELSLLLNQPRKEVNINNVTINAPKGETFDAQSIMGLIDKEISTSGN